MKKNTEKSKIIYKDLPKDDPIKRKPDIAKAKNVLNWQPKVSLDVGLKKTIDYFKVSFCIEMENK